jgi:predicted DsbA family dithiol-disulfide isomerase
MQVEIWSDVVCPWCYIGKRRFERALAQFPHADEVDIVWRSFELDPAAPATIDVDLIDRLAAKYGVPRAQAEAMNARVSGIAAEEGLAYRLDIARPGNTFDAHRMLHLGAAQGVQHELGERLLAAYQSEGRPIADHDTLVQAAIAVGIDEHDARAVLDTDRFADAVRADEETGRQLGITGVPFFAIDRRLGVSGAQSADVLLAALHQAWADRGSPPDDAGA